MTAVINVNRDWVIGIVNDFCNSEENTLNDVRQEAAWDTPLIGFANGADPIFIQYKDVVGPFHWTPLEAIQEGFPDQVIAPGNLTVISWILPQTEATKRDNRQQTTYPAERWARSRIFGEKFNHALRKYIAVTLTSAGYPAVAPMELPKWSVKDSEAYVWASTWSERHAAYAAGLGTFGLCDGLITPKGKAMRTGSVVAHLQLPADPRPYTDHHSYCLFYSHGTCGKCIQRCPANALSAAGHDKRKCSNHLNLTRQYVTENYGFDGYGCGLCQTGVPCESGIPAASDG
jgi:epoxyqueuosine reductase QueG